MPWGVGAGARDQGPGARGQGPTGLRGREEVGSREYGVGRQPVAGLAEVAGKPGAWMLGTTWMPPVELKPEEVLAAPTMPVATAEQVRRRVGKAWEGLGAAAEEMELPGAWAAVREQMAEEPRPLPAEVAKPGPWMLGPGFIPPVEMRAEEAAVGMEQAGQVVGLLGKAWHDVKQAPVVGKPLKAVEAALKTGFEVIFQAPVSAVEEAIGRGITQKAGGSMG